MKKEIITTEKAPVALGPYSQAVKAGKFIFVSGQIAIDPRTGRLVEGGIKAQTRRSLENIKAILEAAGSSLGNVVKVIVFIEDMDDFAAMNRVYGQYFTESFPARCCVQVGKLPIDVKVEIEAIGLI